MAAIQNKDYTYSNNGIILYRYEIVKSNPRTPHKKQRKYVL